MVTYHTHIFVINQLNKYGYYAIFAQAVSTLREPYLLKFLLTCPWAICDFRCGNLVLKNVL